MVEQGQTFQGIAQVLDLLFFNHPGPGQPDIVPLRLNFSYGR